MLFEGMTCPLCERRLDEGGPYLTTWGVPFEESHPLWKFCEMGLHLRCLEDWPDREEFARGYYEQFLGAYDQTPEDVLVTGRHWFLSVGPAEPGEQPYYAEINLNHWPIRLYSHWHEWTENMAGGFAERFVGQSRQEVEAVLGEVWRWAPTCEALRQLREQRRRAGKAGED